MYRLTPCLALLILSAGSGIAQPAHDHAHDMLMSGASKEELRTWTTRDGRKVQGAVIHAGGGKILLQDDRGKKLRVPVKLLSDPDAKRAHTWGNLVAPPADFKADEEVVIHTVFEKMKYDVESFTVAPGSKVRLLLINDDQMAHNLILLKPGKDVGMEVAQKAWALGDHAMKMHWIPKDDRILVHTRMIPGFLSQAIHFTAPTEPGDYPYICSLPGHVQSMKGVMTVSRHKPGLNQLTYRYYTGSWNALPDWSKLEPAATGSLSKNLIDISHRKTNDRFGFVFNGQLVTSKKGTYTFHLGSDDGSSLEINGKRVVNNDGIHGVVWKSGSVALEPGTHAIQVAYFEATGGEELHVGWDGPGFKSQPLSKGFRKGGGSNKGGPKTGIPILVENNEATMYRNFIEGGGARAIGVGYPGEINLSWDADNMHPSMIWLGGFMDGARHWQGRGQGFQPPSGHSVAKLLTGVPFAELGSMSEAWPETLRKSNELRDPEHFRFRGYRLDERMFPAFRYAWKDMHFVDFAEPVADTLQPTLRRTLEVQTEGNHPQLFFRAAAGDITANGDTFEVDELGMRFEGADARLRDIGGQQELLVKVPLRNGSARFIQTITWLNPESPESSE